MIETPRLLTGRDLHDARVTLGRRHYGRIMLASEMARALRLAGADPGGGVMKMEQRSQRPVSGPISQLIEMFLAGAEPVEGWAAIRNRGS